MNDEEKAAVDRLKAMDSVVIEQFDPDNAIWCDIRLVLTALQSATERADRAEAAIDDAMGQGTWNDAFNVLAEYLEAKR